MCVSTVYTVLSRVLWTKSWRHTLKTPGQNLLLFRVTRGLTFYRVRLTRKVVNNQDCNSDYASFRHAFLGHFDTDSGSHWPRVRLNRTRILFVFAKPQNQKLTQSVSLVVLLLNFFFKGISLIKGDPYPVASIITRRNRIYSPVVNFGKS